MKMLYIEDVALNAQVLKLLVERLWKTSLDIAETAEEGLKYIAMNNYDLIYMDIDLPGMNGIEATLEIRRRYNATTLPIIMVSADALSKSIMAAQKAGANDYITKPVKLGQLKDKTEKLVFHTHHGFQVPNIHL